MNKAMYITDDRDHPVEDQRALVIFPGGNGDWYVQVAPAHGRTTEGVRICTSGGAATNCPGLGIAVAEAYRAMQAAERGDPPPRARFELEEEIEAWRRRFPKLMFNGCDLIPAE
jgi:hypothetical protein